MVSETLFTNSKMTPLLSVDMLPIVSDDVKGLHINYDYYDSSFGQLLIASTNKGLCYVGFSDVEYNAISDLRSRYSGAFFTAKQDGFQRIALRRMMNGKDDLTLKMHVKGTLFQLKVWKALLSIPKGGLSSYGDIANAIDNPKASRAMGTAIGQNPIAILIPCHRVIQSSGAIGGYRWGVTRKKNLIAEELI